MSPAVDVSRLCAGVRSRRATEGIGIAYIIKFVDDLNTQPLGSSHDVYGVHLFRYRDVAVSRGE